MTILYVFFAILIFGVLIGTHELGHFLSAKAFGVRVNEFSIGMGPALLQKQKGETLYALRLLPVGGYCALEGEDEQTGDPRAFSAAAWWKKAIILVSGAAMNFLTGFVVVALLFAPMKQYTVPTIDLFYPDCPLESPTGLQVGDTFYKIDGHRIYTQGDVNTMLNLNTTGVFDLVVLRDGQKVTLNDFPMERRAYVIDGQERMLYGLQFAVESNSPIRTLAYAWHTTIDYVRSIPLSIQMIANGQASLSDASGPVGIVEVMAQEGNRADNVADGLRNILSLGAFVAINLGAMNLLPIPALDGGRVFGLVLTTAIEGISGKKVNPKIEAYIHNGGMVVLLALMALVAFKDIFNLFR